MANNYTKTRTLRLSPVFDEKNYSDVLLQANRELVKLAAKIDENNPETFVLIAMLAIAMGHRRFSLTTQEFPVDDVVRSAEQLFKSWQETQRES